MLQRCWSLLSVGLVVALAGCRDETPAAKSVVPVSTVSDRATEPAASWLRDVTAQWGLEFTHEAGVFDAYEMPTIMGSGGCAMDYDRDGLTDVYLVNGRPAAVAYDADLADRGDRIYRQAEPGRLIDVSESSGIRCGEFGMGAWWGDYDADGFADVFLTNVGTNRLFRNLGDGTFEEVPLPAGVADSAWSTAASWCDVDGDTDLDLLVVNYVDYEPGKFCDGNDGRREFCGPLAYQGTVDRLLINSGGHGDGTTELLTDETVSRGIGDERGKGLGVLTQDFNGDGRVDFYVANDMEPNRLWFQTPDGRFENRADLAGVSRNFLGEAEASMGIVSGDWNEDLRPDLFLTHISGETNTLYLSAEGEIWQDGTPAARLGPASLAATGFGVAAIDLQQDGDVDLVVANGEVLRDLSAASCEPPQDCYAQPNAVYLYDATAKAFEARSELALDFTRPVEVSRSLSCADFDQDGDQDLLLTNCVGPARLFENVSPVQGDWLAVRLIDTIGHRDAIGATVRVTHGDGPVQTRYVNPYQGYLSGSDGRVYFGLGKAAGVSTIEVHWPDGAVESFDGIEPNQLRTLIRRIGPADGETSIDVDSETNDVPGAESL